jgi:hypothetical protein
MYIVFVGKLPQLSDYSLRYRKEWYKKKVKGRLDLPAAPPLLLGLQNLLGSPEK